MSGRTEEILRLLTPTLTPAQQRIANGDTLGKVRFAYYGASNTAPASGTSSWVNHMPLSAFEVAGGWAVGGSKAATVATNTTPVTCDIGIIMTGTNDLSTPQFATPTNSIFASIREIVRKSTMPRVLLCAVGPRSDDLTPGEPTLPKIWNITDEYNAALRLFAQDSGYGWINPWSRARASDGRWLTAASHIGDGLHPSADATARSAEEIANAARRLTW